MNLLENLNITSNKIIEKEKLSDLRGGDGESCCYLWCDGTYMGNCGKAGAGTSCGDAEVPDLDCEWMSGTCNQCPYA